MTRKSIYIVRHGETEFNRKGIVQGSQVDAPLNEKGRAQAKLFYESYSDIKPDIIFTSDLQRTKESVQSFIESGVKWEQFSGLNEISWGSDDGKIMNDDPLYLGVIKRWAQGEVDLRAGDGESPQDVFDRQTKFIKDQLENSSESNILICMHGRAMRIFFCQLLKRPLLEMDTFPHANLCLYEFAYENGEFNLVKRNDIKHLTSLNL